jgi:hypothetical protein
MRILFSTGIMLALASCAGDLDAGSSSARLVELDGLVVAPGPIGTDYVEVPFDDIDDPGLVEDVLKGNCPDPEHDRVYEISCDAFPHACLPGQYGIGSAACDACYCIGSRLMALEAVWSPVFHPQHHIPRTLSP